MPLSKMVVPLPLLGGVDTKTAPQLVQPGSFLELENCFRARTGELVKRWGSTALATTDVGGSTGPGSAVSNGDPMLAKFGDGLCLFLPGPQPFSPWTYDPGAGKWSAARTLYHGTPFIPRLVPATNEAFSLSDHTTPDAAYAAGFVLAACEVSTVMAAVVFDWTSGGRAMLFASTTQAVRPKVVAAGQYLCLFYVDTSGAPPNLKCAVYNTASMGSPTTYTLATGTVIAAGSEPFHDEYVPPGQSNVMVAFRNNAGGATCIEFNPATGANVQSAAITADVTLCLGWVVDEFGTTYTTQRLLATAGTTSGVQEKVLTTAMAVSATRTIDASATASVRNITGHVDPVGLSDQHIFWEVSAAATYNYLVRKGTWNGAASVAVWQRSVGLACKPVATGSRYHLGLSYESSTQPLYVFIETVTGAAPEAVVLYGAAGGHTAKTGHLPNVSRSTTSPYQHVTAVLRKNSGGTLGATPFTFKTLQVLELVTNHSTGVPREMGLPKELGGALYVPGGQLKVYDGALYAEALPIVAPETPTLVASAAGGSLTASATYQYAVVYVWPDTNGRLCRSPPSIAGSVTLGGADNRVTVTVPFLRLTSRIAGSVGGVAYELYRTEGDGTVFYKVTLGNNSVTSDSTSVVDTMADATLISGELLYTTGSVLDNFNPPAFTAIETFKNRMWGISAETRTELWFSKELKPGFSLAFNPLLLVRLDGSDGGATALGVIDDKLIIFKRSSVYAMNGAGPDDVGQGSYDTPELVTAQQGTVNPRSVVATPDGLMFEGSRGIWILGRDLQVSYLGAAVEAYTTTGVDITGAVHLPAQQQVRFFTAAGRTLVWDYLQKQWYTFTGQAAGAAIAIGTQAYWAHPTTDVVSYENDGTYGGDAGVGYAMRVGLPNLALAGVLGFQRAYAMQLLGTVVGSHTLAIDLEYDYSGVTLSTGALASANAWPRSEFRFPRQRCTSIKPTLYETAANTAGGFKLVHAALLIGVKGGLGRLPSANRLT